jgi:predicted amidohydrolase YtcJ
LSERLTLYRGGRIVAPGTPTATAFAAAGETIVWIGTDDATDQLVPDETVDLDGALVTPAFVDAHVHLTQTGLALTGLDLSGARSLAEALDMVNAAARSLRGGVLIGSGWDETRWPEQRPPTATELDRASWGSVAYLARVDAHSAIASSALLAMSKAGGLAGDDGDGLVRLDAHHAVRGTALKSLSRSDIAQLQRAALRHAASRGVACVHEMSGPEIAGLRDLECLLDVAAEPGAIDVVAYWAQLGDVETSQRLGLRGAGGDLFCDGSVGSHTAALHEAYADDPTSGSLRYDGDQVAEHVTAAVQAGLQCGFHVIGDAAIDAALDGFEKAADTVGLLTVAAGRHRLEHVELASDEAIARMARLGLVASVQPVFDALWGGPDGMYARRLGAERAAMMNPLARFVAAGVPLCISSDSPVTPLDPWAAVWAAVRHQSPGSGVTPKAAFAASTRGGWRAVGRDDEGVLATGAPATFAVWAAAPSDAAPADERIGAWATDPDWAATGLPEVGTSPECRRTVVRGTVVFDSGGKDSAAH